VSDRCVDPPPPPRRLSWVRLAAAVSHRCVDPPPLPLPPRRPSFLPSASFLSSSSLIRRRWVRLVIACPTPPLCSCLAPPLDSSPAPSLGSYPTLPPRPPPPSPRFSSASFPPPSSFIRPRRWGARFAGIGLRWWWWWLQLIVVVAVGRCWFSSSSSMSSPGSFVARFAGGGSW